MTVTASPLPHIIVATVRCSPSQQKSVNGMENHSPIPAAPLTVTHPFIPSLGRENIPLKPLIIKQKAVFKSPLLRGAGVCDVCAQLPEIKNIHLKPTDTSSQQQAFRNCISQHLIPCRASHHNTPLSPLSRGENITLKPLIIKQKTAYQTSPLERGGGV